MAANPAVIAALEQAKAAMEELEVALALKSKEKPEEAAEMPMEGMHKGPMMDEE